MVSHAHTRRGGHFTRCGQIEMHVLVTAAPIRDQQCRARSRGVMEMSANITQVREAGRAG